MNREIARRYGFPRVDRRNPSSDGLAGFNLAAALANPQFTFVEADAAHADAETIVSGADAVYHPAAVPGVRSSWGLRFADYATTNVVDTQRLLAACKSSGVRRLVYASSSSGTARRRR